MQYSNFLFGLFQFSEKNLCLIHLKKFQFHLKNPFEYSLSKHLAIYHILLFSRFLSYYLFNLEAKRKLLVYFFIKLWLNIISFVIFRCQPNWFGNSILNFNHQIPKQCNLRFLTNLVVEVSKELSAILHSIMCLYCFSFIINEYSKFDLSKFLLKTHRFYVICQKQKEICIYFKVEVFY